MIKVAGIKGLLKKQKHFFDFNVFYGRMCAQNQYNRSKIHNYSMQEKLDD